MQTAIGARAVGIVAGTGHVDTLTKILHKADLETARDIWVAYLRQA